MGVGVLVPTGGSGGVLIQGWPGELPGRGKRCLAAERGECGQGK
jgi:hypothetical protein